MQSRSNNNLKGIDVSNWEENINFQSVKNYGVEVTKGATGLQLEFHSSLLTGGQVIVDLI
ncbi:hypothetical protein EQY69_14445 [Clostridium perfringens]|nr:hypothetical protein [Clostridium perfringens]